MHRQKPVYNRKMFKAIFATIGFVFVALYILGLLGVGHFAFYYGPDKKICVNEKSIRINAEPIQLKIEELKR